MLPLVGSACAPERQHVRVCDRCGGGRFGRRLGGSARRRLGGGRLDRRRRIGAARADGCCNSRRIRSARTRRRLRRLRTRSCRRRRRRQQRNRHHVVCVASCRHGCRPDRARIYTAPTHEAAPPAPIQLSRAARDEPLQVGLRKRVGIVGWTGAAPWRAIERTLRYPPTFRAIDR